MLCITQYINRPRPLSFQRVSHSNNNVYFSIYFLACSVYLLFIVTYDATDWVLHMLHNFLEHQTLKIEFRLTKLISASTCIYA